jgi:hypothetical protein
MNDTYYFSHDYNPRGDEKMQKLIFEMSWDGYGLFWALVELLYQNDGFMQYDCKRIAFELRTDENKINQLINNFELFKIKDGCIYSDSVLHRLKKRKGKTITARKAAKIRWDKVKQNDANAMQTHNKCNAIKESKVNKEYIYSEFYDLEIINSNNDENYIKVVKILFGENNLGIFLSSVLKMETQLNYIQFKKIWFLKEKYKISITEILEQMENWKDLKKRKTVYSTFLTFAKKRNPEIKC